MTTKVKSIEIEVGGKTVRLTPAEARNLRDELDSLLGKQRVVHVPVYLDTPYRWHHDTIPPVWTTPTYTSDPLPLPPVITCGQSS